MVCMHASTQLCMYVTVASAIRKLLNLCMYVYIYVCMYACMSIYVCMYACMYVCMYVFKITYEKELLKLVIYMN